MKLGSVELTIDRDVKSGEKASIFSLFPWWEQTQNNFKALADIKVDTKINVKVPKFETLQTQVPSTAINKKPGDVCQLFFLIPWPDNNKELTALEDAKKGEKVTVNIET